MKITATEMRLVLANRHRLALDDKDWAHEPTVTFRQLAEMSPRTRDQFATDAEGFGKWQPDYAAQCLRNIEHPANKVFAQTYLLNVLLRQERK